jgi:hypothetical protein
LPVDASELVENGGPVIWIRSHFFVIFSLKLGVPGISGGRAVKLDCPRV